METSYFFFSKKMFQKLGRVFVVHHNGTEDGSWSPLVHCTEIPLEIVLGSTMGILFLACLAAFIAILVRNCEMKHFFNTHREVYIFRLYFFLILMYFRPNLGL